MDLQLNAKSALQCGSIQKHWCQLRVTSAGMLRAQLPHGICSCPWIRCERGSIDLCMLSPRDQPTRLSSRVMFAEALQQQQQQQQQLR